MKSKILIIEDDPDILEMETSELERKNFKVFAAADAATARRLLSNDRFDCILLDLNLGSESGRDILTFMRKDKSLNTNTPVILVSGELDPGSIKEMREEIDTVLVKPFRYKELFARIASAIGKVAPTSIKRKKGPQVKRTMNVLVVDDDREYGESICEILQDININVIYSETSIDAMKKLENQRFDCILMDYKLESSSRNGDWIVAQIRKEIGHPNFKTPVLVISGALQKDNTTFAKENIQGFVNKPIANTVITQLVERIINRRSPA